tara:strand:+ start:485 stop:790 length:306 start_codon:yes stop_codon:yes gene_type:complete
LYDKTETELFIKKYADDLDRIKSDIEEAWINADFPIKENDEGELDNWIESIMDDLEAAIDCLKNPVKRLTNEFFKPDPDPEPDEDEDEDFESAVLDEMVRF